jgi:predicted MFS family arabinose efflux permease
MDQSEKRSTFLLATIYAFRMLGLFMILPIFTLYANRFADSTSFLIGVALGIYGLSQALLQIIFGITSDKIGRKPVIVFGLILFIFGSIIAACSHTIYGVIIGRAIQGAGAIGSTLTAMVADVTKEENRMKAMSIIGMTIGLSFIVAIILSPLLNNIIGLSGIFWLTASFGVIGIFIITIMLPTPKNHILHRDSGTVLGDIIKIIKMPELLRLNYGIFALHATLTALFIIIPQILTNVINIEPDHQWYIYLPVLVLSFIFMIPFIIAAEAKRKMKKIFVGAIATLAASQALLILFHQNVIPISLILLVFFTCFTFLEASLPSLISKISPAGKKGTAMGVYSSMQFFGIFIGGSLGGVLYHHFAANGIFSFCLILTLIWVFIAYKMKNPKHLSSLIVNISKKTEHAKTTLLDIKGVEDAAICEEEMVAYLKVDKEVLDNQELKKIYFVK